LFSLCATGVVDTSCNFTNGVIDTAYRRQFATNVNGTSDTNGKFAASNVDTVVIDTGGAP
jgi:hypothetical protein